MSAPQTGGAAGDDLEEALRTYEAALVQAAPGRHSRPDDDDHLQRLRMQVIRLAEALPSACWPRPVCAQCEGEREVEAVRPSYRNDASTPGVATLRRLCPVCWGTGMTLSWQTAG